MDSDIAPDSDVVPNGADHPYNALTPDCIINAVESQGHISNARLLALNSYENRVYQVGMDSGPPIIAKFYRPERWADEQILEEHQFTQQLFDLDIPVVPPLADSAGQTLFNYKGFRFSLYPRQGGHAPELDDDDNLVIMGRYLGRIHAAGATRPFQHRVDLGIDRFALESYYFIREHRFIPAELEQAYCSVCEDVLLKLRRRFSEVKYSSIRLHGDCHRGNVLWRDQRPHFVDFDDACNGPALQDLWMLLAGDREAQTIQINKLLEGYEQFATFPLQQLNLLEALRTLRIMYYAAWLARRWDDPAFPLNFPWFNTTRYWSNHILELREQLAALDEAPLVVNL